MHLLEQVRRKKRHLGIALNSLGRDQVTNPLLRKLVDTHGLDGLECCPADVEAKHVKLWGRRRE